MTNPLSPRFSGFIRDVRTSKRNLQQSLSQPATTISANSTETQLCSPRTSVSSTSPVDQTDYQALRKINETLKTDIHHLTHSNEDNVTKLNLQLQKYNELQESYKHLENKYNQLLDIEERYNKDKLSYDICLQENEQLKQKQLSLENEINQKYLDEINKQKEKIYSLENDLLIMKSTTNNQQDLQKIIEQLQTELQFNIKEREATSISNTQLRTEITNTTNTNERLTNECEKLRTALIAKSDEFDLKQRENEQLKIKNLDLESMIKSLQATNDLQKRLNDENENNKQELQRKQDDFEQFQRMHDVSKQEHQAIIQLLQEKIHELERKTELQSSKHDEILRQFESLKKRPERVLPSSIGTIVSPNNQQNSLSTMIDSQTLQRDDSAPIHSHQQSANSNEKLAQIVIAKYSYEPLRFSPNDHPEIELPLKQGEYYLIYGIIDEDGFYDGRNLEGRYGLIPSNFIELVKNPNDLPENTKHMIQKLTGKIFPSNERISRQREQTFSIDSDVFVNNSSIPTSKILRPTNSSSSDVSTDEYSYGKHIPCPTNLHIEKSLNNNILIAWNPPLSNIQILGYQILLDHSLYTTIRIHERTSALIENINLNEKPHRISIRTITQRGLSRDQECTLLLTNSKDLAFIPSDLRVDRITQTSAVVSWWPASNDIIHKLFVNDIEVQTLKPGIYRFKLSGLLPNTLHKVTIKAKPPIVSTPQQQLTTSTEFRTTSFDETIEPPRRVQAIAGPQLNTLLISWEQPSSINTVRGYRILIDGRQIQDITNPLSDHIIINLNKLHYGRYLTMRTLSENNSESNDSIPVDIDDIIKKCNIKEAFVTFQTNSDNEIIKSPHSPIIKNQPKTSRPLPIISQELSKSTINEKDIHKTFTRPSLESPSTISSVSTDIPQIELKPNSPKITPNNKQRNYSDLNQIRTPVNENFNINKSIISEEQRSIPSTSIKNLRLQPSTGINNHLLNKINTSPRLFIALFDYDPHAMSPNQDNEEELPFKQGQIIKIFGDQDADGFYIGQTETGRTGYVPSNMVSEIEADESEIEPHISTVSPTKRTSPVATPIKKMVALFDYNPSENSPNINPHDELSFHSGDIIYVRGNIHDDGFYSGELNNGKKGLVPSNYLKEITDENIPPKDTETNENKQTLTNVNKETETHTEKPVEPPTVQPSAPSTQPSAPSTQPSPPSTQPSSPPTQPSSPVTQSSAQPPPPASTEPPKAGFFDRLKNTFSWNSSEPI